jgi:hypothetical protein
VSAGTVVDVVEVEVVVELVVDVGGGGSGPSA